MQNPKFLARPRHLPNQMAASGPAREAAQTEAEGWISDNDEEVFPIVLLGVANAGECCTLDFQVTPGDGEPFTVTIQAPASYNGSASPSDLVSWVCAGTRQGSLRRSPRSVAPLFSA